MPGRACQDVNIVGLVWQSRVTEAACRRLNYSIEQRQLIFQMLWSGYQNSRILGLCCCQTCVVLALPLLKKLAPLDVRIFHLLSVVMELTISSWSHSFNIDDNHCCELCVPCDCTSTSPLRAHEKIDNIAYVGNTEHFSNSAVSSTSFSCGWASDTVPVKDLPSSASFTLTVYGNPEHTSFIMPRRAWQELWRIGLASDASHSHSMWWRVQSEFSPPVRNLLLAVLSFRQVCSAM